MLKRLSCFLLLVVQLLSIYACSSNDKEIETISTLRIGVLPDESKEKLEQHYTPLFKYLSDEIGLPYELVIPESYSELVELFHKQKIDLAYFGGFTFIKAHTSDNAVPLVMRNVDTRFTTYFLVKGDSPHQSLHDLRGKKLSFGSRLSTSGHLMPRYFLKEMGIVPEDFFSEVNYSGKHDKTAQWVAQGRVDVGAANYKVIDSMFKDGRITNRDVRILWETPPYPDYVWALRSSINKTIQIKLREAFLSLSKNNKKHAEILEGVGAESFLPAGINDFIKLKSVINDLSLLGAD